MEYQLSPNQWLLQPKEVRLRFAEVFNIPRSKGSVLEGGKVVSDGHTFEDLSVITIEKMQEFLGTNKKDFMTLFNEVVNKLNKPETLKEEVKEDLQKNEWTAILLRIKGQSVEQKREADLLQLIKETFNINANAKKTK